MLCFRILNTAVVSDISHVAQNDIGNCLGLHVRFVVIVSLYACWLALFRQQTLPDVRLVPSDLIVDLVKAGVPEFKTLWVGP